ncbi:hypothetical protein E2B42_12200 [Listeria monocytogenes]|nr:hypothetical protein [Listeria monocytogenes]EAE5650264.1 hypothetical protein [Listeria monocytogenes]
MTKTDEWFEFEEHRLHNKNNTVAIIILLTNSAMFGYFPTNLSNRLRKPGLISSVSRVFINSVPSFLSVGSSILSTSGFKSSIVILEK